MNKQCGWCASPATAEITLEPERYRYEVKNGKRNRIVAKSAIVVGVCEVHKRSLYLRQEAKPDNYKVKK